MELEGRSGQCSLEGHQGLLEGRGAGVASGTGRLGMKRNGFLGLGKNKF